MLNCEIEKGKFFLRKNPASPEPEIIFLQVGQLLSKPLPLAKDTLQEEIISKILIRLMLLMNSYFVQSGDLVTAAQHYGTITNAKVVCTPPCCSQRQCQGL